SCPRGRIAHSSRRETDVERGGRLCLFVARSALSLALQALNGTPQSEVDAPMKQLSTLETFVTYRVRCVCARWATPPRVRRRYNHFKVSGGEVPPQIPHVLNGKLVSAAEQQ
ncbi:jg17575, partial [Pararge aegeria aegeria]